MFTKMYSELTYFKDYVHEMLCFALRMPLDFKEAVGEDDASKDNFCEVQKDQVPKFGVIKTNFTLETTKTKCSLNVPMHPFPDRRPLGHGLSKPEELHPARGQRDRRHDRRGLRGAGGRRVGEGHRGPAADDLRGSGMKEGRKDSGFLIDTAEISCLIRKISYNLKP